MFRRKCYTTSSRSVTYHSMQNSGTDGEDPRLLQRGMSCLRCRDGPWLEPFEAEIEWIDVHRDNIAVAQLGTELEFVLERLHVVDAAGETHIGTEAFAVLWLLSPRQRCFGRIARWPVIRPVPRAIYNLFAAGLYLWNLRKRYWLADARPSRLPSAWQSRRRKGPLRRGSHPYAGLIAAGPCGRSAVSC